MLCDWLKKIEPLFNPIKSATKTNCDGFPHIFPRFESASCNYFEFWLVHWLVSAHCDWLERLLCFWFYDTQLKTSLFQYSLFRSAHASLHVAGRALKKGQAPLWVYIAHMLECMQADTHEVDSIQYVVARSVSNSRAQYARFPLHT